MTSPRSPARDAGKKRANVTAVSRWLCLALVLAILLLGWMDRRVLASAVLQLEEILASLSTLVLLMVCGVALGGAIAMLFSLRRPATGFSDGLRRFRQAVRRTGFPRSTLADASQERTRSRPPAQSRKHQQEKGGSAGPTFLVPTSVLPREQSSMARALAEEACHSPYETQSELPVLENEVTKRDTVPGRGEKQASVAVARQNEPVQECSPLRLVVGVGLDPGIVRQDAPNEDDLFALQGSRITSERKASIGLFVVADGMGGHANGQEASHLATRCVSDVVVPVLMRNTDAALSYSDLLKEGVQQANLTFLQRNQCHEAMMGTTLTAALVVDASAYVANVGDSRTYLYRESEGLSQITRDHSHVALMVEHGVITREEMYTHPKRNQVYRCLGDKAEVEVDTFLVPLRSGDLLVLCSDGLWEMVRDAEIERIMACTWHPAQSSAMFVQAALNRGGVDNVSVVVVHVGAESELARTGCF